MGESSLPLRKLLSSLRTIEAKNVYFLLGIPSGASFFLRMTTRRALIDLCLLGIPSKGNLNTFSP